MEENCQCGAVLDEEPVQRTANYPRPSGGSIKHRSRVNAAYDTLVVTDLHRENI